jgi:hypothetical protein
MPIYPERMQVLIFKGFKQCEYSYQKVSETLL